MTECGAFPVFNGGMEPSGFSDEWNTQDSIIISEGGNSCGFVNHIKGRFWRGGHCYRVQSAIEPSFLFQMLKYHEPEIMSLRVGSGLPNIQKTSLYGLHVSLPRSASEQRCIASVLASVDARLDALSALAVKQEAIKKSTLKLLMEPKPGWRSESIGVLYDISSGLSKPADAFGTGFPFLSFMTIFNNPSLPDTLDRLVESTSQERRNCSIRRGDIFLTRTSETLNELGMSSVALHDYPNATFNGFSKRLRPKSNEILPVFGVHYFRTKRFRNQIDNIAVVTTRASLNSAMMRKLKIEFPSLSEQRQIAQELSALDAARDATQSQIAKTHLLKQGLMRHFFG